MRTNFVLVDFENIQPKDLGLLKDGPFKVKLFLGPNQAKIPIALALLLHSLGGNAEYVVLETAGNNALDFHIAYYIGVLSTEDPSAYFHIISKDSWFYPLVRHLKGEKCLRSALNLHCGYSVFQTLFTIRARRASSNRCRRSRASSGIEATNPEDPAIHPARSVQKGAF